MRRALSGMLLPLLLAVAGVALIIVGQLDLDRPSAGSSLQPIPDPTNTPIPIETPRTTPSNGGTPEPTPEPTPIPRDWVATQIQIESVGINTSVHKCTNPGCDSFPADDSAFILREASQPGRGTNSYIFAHAVNHLFKPLWNVQLGARIKILMSDGAVLRYQVTEIHPNVPCPDDNPPNPELNPDRLGVTLPLALRGAEDCSAGVIWTQPTDHERLTLQTSQGYNRNWGELVVVADPL
ncbi:MAG TPA: sortase [Candidatus Limnocylindria bacterium]|jgi:sortase (surface protein transpeptidase)|nr:sortase [Candidatus Limnocylindria bacterium]